MNRERARSLNLLFITQNDPFYVKAFFEEFLKAYRFPEEIKGVIVCSTMAAKSLRRLARKMFNFYGLFDFLRMGFRMTKAKCLDVLSRLFGAKRFYSLKHLFSAHGIHIENRNDINSERFLGEWKNRSIDVIVSVAAPLIFRKRLLQLPNWGCINIHHSKLPRYRGMMPNFWHMYWGEKKAGITVHLMNPKIDQGEIVLQREIPIRAGESLDLLITRTKKQGAHCVIEALDLIRTDKVVCLPNNPEQGEYFSFPKEADVREFRRRGNRLL